MKITLSLHESRYLFRELDIGTLYLIGKQLIVLCILAFAFAAGCRAERAKPPLTARSLRPQPGERAKPPLTARSLCPQLGERANC